MAPGLDSISAGDFKALQPALTLIIAVIIDGMMGVMMVMMVVMSGRMFPILVITQPVLNVDLRRVPLQQF